MNRNEFMNLKKFLIFTVNYLKCFVVNFKYFINCSFTSKNSNQWVISKLAIYEGIRKQLCEYVL